MMTVMKPREPIVDNAISPAAAGEMAQEIMRKLRSLAPPQMYVVSHLIDFLRDQKEEEDDMRRWAMLASQSVLRKMDDEENGAV